MFDEIIEECDYHSHIYRKTENGVEVLTPNCGWKFQAEYCDLGIYCEDCAIAEEDFISVF